MTYIKMQNGEREKVVRRFKIPGKGRGFLSVTDGGNCYITLAGSAWWVCDLCEHPEVDRTDRRAVLAVFKTEQINRNSETLAALIKERLKK